MTNTQQSGESTPLIERREIQAFICSLATQAGLSRNTPIEELQVETGGKGGFTGLCFFWTGMFGEREASVFPAKSVEDALIRIMEAILPPRDGKMPGIQLEVQRGDDGKFKAVVFSIEYPNGETWKFTPLRRERGKWLYATTGSTGFVPRPRPIAS